MKKVTKGQTKAEAVKVAKDNATKAAHERIAQSKAVAAKVSAEKQAKIEAAAAAAKSGAALKLVTDGPVTNGDSVITPVKESRYLRHDGEFAMSIKAGMENAKTEVAEYVPEQAHIFYATTFATANDDALVDAIKALGRGIGDIQGKLGAACAGLAYRLQEKKGEAIPALNDFIEAIQPWGQRLTAIRSNEVIRWFTEMACVDYGKSEVKGEGKVFTFSADKFRKENSKFSKDKDGWLRSKIARPFWLVKPEPELKEFSLIDELVALYERAAKLDKKAADPVKAGYKVIDLNGLSSLGVAVNRIRSELAKQRAQEAANGSSSEGSEADETTKAENAAA